ncbi:hypothetical protein LUZ63_013657 [Rhynchospora breviuscula]|uniref:Uncharacterized protein n=1 Tax=Rhynchospora breviuscula TaxID=2022672 RepID=A0A9Q0HKD2_9POAL|nr:hypothetical protein LUZ63_013657 [Rhynchospora breviuscula]
MNKIKASYKVKKGWSGDPCVPTELSWTGIICTSDSSNIPRITSLDLSYNDLSGDLPSFLDQLSALTYLDITGNSKISTTLPPGLQKRNQEGNLTFRFGGAPLQSPSDNNKKKKSPAVIIAIAGVVVLLLIAAVIMTVLFLKRHKSTREANTKGNNAGLNYAHRSKPIGSGEGMLNFENRQFTYYDLKTITNNIQNNIGTGGFGSVYVGVLENGTQVAVKMRSH